MASGLHTGFELDRRWHWLRGEMDETKKPALLQLARVLEQCAVPYAIIGGVAMQVHQDEPRTTLDIDVAVEDRTRIPEAALVAAASGAREPSRTPSENWDGPGATPVQFTDDPELRSAVSRAIRLPLEDLELRILLPAD